MSGGFRCSNDDRGVSVTIACLTVGIREHYGMKYVFIPINE